MELELSIAQKNYSLSVQKKNEYYQVKIADRIIELNVVQVTPNCIMLTEENNIQRICIVSTKESTFIHLNGRQHIVDHPEQKEKTSYQGDEPLLGADHGICSPMPGKILRILVQENQEVTPKQNLVIVEAMKMEHNIRSPRNGIIKKINFSEGDLVDTGQEILELDIVSEQKIKMIHEDGS